MIYAIEVLKDCMIQRLELELLKLKSDYNVDLQSTYDKIINQYENDYFSLPEAEIMQLQDAKAMIDLQEEAARRYKQYGIKTNIERFQNKNR